MRTYERMIGSDKYQFRLTVGAQKVLEKKFGEQANQFVFACADSVEKMTYLLGAAASYQGNENPTTNGDEIYDLLVDDGVAGQDGFFGVAIEIAVASGITSEKFAGKSLAAVEKMMQEVIDDLDPTLEAIPEEATEAAEN